MSIRYPVNTFLFLFFFFLLLPLWSQASTPQIPPRPPGYVVDLAGVLDGQSKRQLSTLLQDLENRTTVQMVILTVDSLDGQDINSFSLQTAEQWKIGQKDKDNGLLFVIAMRDRKYRFEVGYGLEEILPDSVVGTIGRKTLVPYFKQGRYVEGITGATGEILKIIGNRYGVEMSGVDQLAGTRNRQQEDGFSGLIFFFFVLVSLLIMYSRSVNRKMRPKGGYRSGRPGSGPVIFPGGGWGGGGFSGGFGGFSGGGGGFGGGGASGGW